VIRSPCVAERVKIGPFRVFDQMPEDSNRSGCDWGDGARVNSPSGVGCAARQGHDGETIRQRPFGIGDRDVGICRSKTVARPLPIGSTEDRIELRAAGHREIHRVIKAARAKPDPKNENGIGSAQALWWLRPGMGARLIEG